MWMAEARDRADWNRTFAILAQIYNANRDPDKSTPSDPMQFFPWEKPKPARALPATAADVALLKHMYPGKKT